MKEVHLVLYMQHLSESTDSRVGSASSLMVAWVDWVTAIGRNTSS